VGLVHCLLRVTPESQTEQQPLARPDGRLAITADARLDNRAEVCAALGRPDDGQPDAALILAAYERWGETCPERLLGDFAFAIWDGTEHKLFCARDILGGRPFFYFGAPGLFVFASALEGVARFPGVPRAINEARVAVYLTGGNDAVNTFYRDIYRLPPAHTLTVSAAGLRLRRYWDLGAPRETRLPSDEAYAEAFRHHLSEAVRTRLRSAGPVGAMLSGGLDSSSVVCLARPMLAEHGEMLHTFSLLYNRAPASDERQFMAPVVAGGGLAHHELVGDGQSLVSRVEELLTTVGEPYYNFGLSLQAMANEAARAAGLRVLLGGDFGDAVVSHANLRFAELVRSGRWLTAAREVNGLARGLHFSRRTTLAYFLSSGLVPQIPPAARRGWRRLRDRLRSGQLAWAAGTAMHRDFARRVSAEAALIARIEQRQPTFRTTYEESRFYLSQTSIQAEVFSHLAAHTGVEARHPFHDRRLIEFCLGLPGEQRLNGGWSRLIQRRAMAGILPEEIRWRRDKVIPIHSVSRALMEAHLPELDRLLAAARAAGEWLDLDLLARDQAQLQMAAARGEHEHPQHRRALGRLARALHLGLWLRQAGFI
jgi:asparagine synthase (glutamine-hydrolysing)